MTRSESAEKENLFLSVIDTEGTRNESLRRFLKGGGNFGMFEKLIRKHNIKFKKTCKKGIARNSIRATKWIRSIKDHEWKLPDERIREIACIRTGVYPSTMMVRRVKEQIETDFSAEHKRIRREWICNHSDDAMQIIEMCASVDKMIELYNCSLPGYKPGIKERICSKFKDICTMASKAVDDYYDFEQQESEDLPYQPGFYTGY